MQAILTFCVFQQADFIRYFLGGNPFFDFTVFPFLAILGRQ